MSAFNSTKRKFSNYTDSILTRLKIDWLDLITKIFLEKENQQNCCKSHKLWHFCKCCQSDTASFGDNKQKYCALNNTSKNVYFD